MADSVREVIMKQIQTTLEGITVANGYANTMQSVQRFRQDGQVLTATPLCVLMEGGDNVQLDGPYPLITRHLTVSVVIIHRQDLDTDTRSASEVMNSLVADVLKAMHADFTRGGHALETSELGIGELDAEEGQPELVQTVGFQIGYRHRRDDPTLET